MHIIIWMETIYLRMQIRMVLQISLNKTELLLLYFADMGHTSTWSNISSYEALVYLYEHQIVWLSLFKLWLFDTIFGRSSVCCDNSVVVGVAAIHVCNVFCECMYLHNFAFIDNWISRYVNSVHLCALFACWKF